MVPMGTNGHHPGQVSIVHRLQLIQDKITYSLSRIDQPRKVRKAAAIESVSVAFEFNYFLFVSCLRCLRVNFFEE